MDFLWYEMRRLVKRLSHSVIAISLALLVVGQVHAVLDKETSGIAGAGNGPHSLKFHYRMNWKEVENGYCWYFHFNRYPIQKVSNILSQVVRFKHRPSAFNSGYLSVAIWEKSVGDKWLQKDKFVLREQGDLASTQIRDDKYHHTKYAHPSFTEAITPNSVLTLCTNNYDESLLTPEARFPVIVIYTNN